VYLGFGERPAVDGEYDARQDMSLADRGSPWRRPSPERPGPVRHRRCASWRGRSRDAGTRDDQNERPEREADCDEPSHTMRSNRWRPG
jgi:hypothetical protein